MFFKIWCCLFAFQKKTLSPLNKFDWKYDGGFDTRFNKTFTSDTTQVENIILNFQKKQLLGLLQNPSISRIEKLKKIEIDDNPFHFRFQLNDEFNEFA